LDVFCSILKKNNPDAVLLSGDISLSQYLGKHLLALENRLEMPVFFVLGNHDFWGSSIEKVRKNVTTLSSKSRYLRYLSSIPYIPLSPSTVIIGHDGWYDGLNGNPAHSKFVMNDWNLISDFATLKNHCNLGHDLQAILNVARKHAVTAARHIALGINSSLQQHKPNKIIVATHVPPFVNPLDFHRSVSAGDLYPWYSSKIMGDMLLTAAKHNPHVQFKVFCGHIHTNYEGYVTPNLLLRSGKSEYSEPTVQGFYDIL
jgi:predicted phosphohydrolase